MQPNAAAAAQAQPAFDRAQQAEHAKQAQQPQQAQHAVSAVRVLPAAVQQVQQSPGAAQHLPPSPAGRELTHVSDFMTPQAESVLHHREFAAPAAAQRAAPTAQRVAELQREGQEGGSGGSLEGESEMQPIPVIQSEAANNAEEADYGQMVQELQQVLTVFNMVGQEVLMP